METIELESFVQPSRRATLSKTEVYYYVAILCFVFIIFGFGPSLLHKLRHRFWCIPASCIENELKFEVNMHAFGGYTWSLFLLIQIYLIRSKFKKIHKWMGKTLMPILFLITFVFAIPPTFTGFEIEGAWLLILTFFVPLAIFFVLGMWAAISNRIDDHKDWMMLTCVRSANPAILRICFQFMYIGGKSCFPENPTHNYLAFLITGGVELSIGIAALHLGQKGSNSWECTERYLCFGRDHKLRIWKLMVGGLGMIPWFVLSILRIPCFSIS